ISGSQLNSQIFRYGWCETVRRLQGLKIEEPYNIFEVENMTLNDINTAIGRTTVWQDVRFDSTKCKKKYMRVTYNHKCFYLKAKQLEIVDGFVYEYINGSDFYVGETIDPKKRHQEHLDEDKWFANPETKYQIVKSISCTKKQLREMETARIRELVLKGLNPRNKKQLPRNINQPTVQIVHKVECDRFQITHNIKEQFLRIQYRDHEGNKHCEKFGYKQCGIEEAKKKAEERRNE